MVPLARLRRRVPWTQGELAAAGVSVGTVRGLEHGPSKTVRPRVIRALAAALGVARRRSSSSAPAWAYRRQRRGRAE